MRIKELKISNFHCYQNSTFIFAKKATILIGKNGSGKSSLIKSIKNALSIFFSNNPSWDYPTIVGNVSDLSVANLASREIWHDNNMKPAEYVDIKVEAEKISDISGETERFPEWSFHKLSTAKAKLQSSYYKDAYIYFRQNYVDNAPWPLFAYYSDRYPHIDANLSSSIKQMIDNDEKLYRCWAYYHWDNDASCAFIWQKRYMRIYNLYFKRQQALTRIGDSNSAEAIQCQKDIEKYESEINFVLKYLKYFTSNTNEYLSNKTNSLEITDIIVDGIDNPYLVAYFADGTHRRWDELPAGYERLYNIVFDIAYRSYILNGSEVEPQGIVLIDELDLHLHPSMEQDVLLRLTSTFKNIQFIVATHSPLVISNTSLGDDGQVILLSNENGEYCHNMISDSYGMGYEFILSSVMQTEPSNIRIQQLKEKYLRLMRRNRKDTAYQTLSKIKDSVSNESYVRIKEELDKKLVEE